MIERIRLRTMNRTVQVSWVLEYFRSTKKCYYAPFSRLIYTSQIFLKLLLLYFPDMPKYKKGLAKQETINPN